jgi:hypothetical protein
MKYIKDDKRGQLHLEKAIAKMALKPHVAVGILQDKPVTKEFSMIDLAIVHEYGSKDGRIPKRSFMRSTCDTKCKEHGDLILKLQEKYIAGKLSLKKALMQLGEIVSKHMVQAINQGIEPELALATVRRKKSSKALIHHGHLKGSIKPEVRGA